MPMSSVEGLLQLLLLLGFTSFHLAQAQSTGDLRLADSTLANAGRLEIFLQEKWGTVCDDFFSATEANVACRQLGYSYADRQGNVGTLGQAYQLLPGWMMFRAATLLSCHHSGIGIENCDHSEDVALICAGAVNANNGVLRLVNLTSTNATAGRLEIFLNGEWGTVCDDGFGTMEADVVCRQLGYPSSSRVGNVIMLGYPQASLSVEIWLDDVSCSSSATRLLSCSHSGVGIENCGHTEDVAIECGTSSNSGGLRLVGSSRTGSGRLEIFLHGEWGTVCDDGFGTTEGNVACRQLGYDSVSSVGSVGRLGYSQASSDTEIWLDDVDCSSSDSTLLSCSHRGIGVENCGHSEDVALVCSTSSFGGSRALSTGVVTTIVVAIVFAFAVGVPALFLCISKKNRGGLITRNRRFHSTSAAAAVITASANTSTVNPQPAPYPTAAFVTPQAQQAPPPHPSSTYQHSDKPHPDSTLQEAPPPSYSQAMAYPPPAYPGQTSGVLPTSTPYPTPEAPGYAQPSAQQPVSSTAGPSTNAPYPLNPGLYPNQPTQTTTPGYPPQNHQTPGYPPQDPGCPQHPPQNTGYPQQAPHDPGYLAYPPPTAYASPGTSGAAPYPAQTSSGGNAPSAPPP